jgi:hypothetical protein
MFAMASEHGRLNFASWSDFHFFKSAVFESTEFDIDYIRKALKKAYISFYFRPNYLLHQIKNISSWAQLRRKLRGLRLLRNVLQA